MQKSPEDIYLLIGIHVIFSEKYLVNKGEMKIMDITQYKSSVRDIVEVKNAKRNIKGGEECNFRVSKNC